MQQDTGYMMPLAHIALASADGPAESWVQLLPAGQFDLKDKRGPWAVKDMEAVIARSQTNLKRGMPVDMDHALDRHRETEAPAAGWVEELAAREDGIWGRIAWTPTGKAKVEGREYRFISPVVMVRRDGEVMAINRAGLTNNPAIMMQALCAAEEDTAPDADDPHTEADIVAMLRDVLGVPADTSVQALMDRLTKVLAMADTTKTDNHAVKELASGYMALLTERHEERVEVVLERARDSGKLVPCMEGWAQELASRDIESFEAWEASTLPFVNLGPPQLAGKTPPIVQSHGRHTGNTERHAICSQLGIAPEAMGGEA